MRFFGISCISFLLTSVVVMNAYYQKKQFYPSVVYITKSNPSMAVIYIQAFIGVWILGKLMRKIFFGQLRSTEFEHLMERSWYAVTETCLAFTVFRDDFTPKFVALFTLLLFLKSFHWLAEDRVDYMERSPIIGFLFHLRILCLLLLLGSLDLMFINYAYQSTVTKGASVQLVFGFEYAILITVVINIGIKYGLHSMDLNSDSPWDDKAVFLLYTELVIGFIKVILYIAFVAITVRIYTLPLFAFRPMYYTIRNFKRAFSDVILSRRAIHNMNTLYPNATLEELAAADNVCIICREEMVTASKKLPCNHIFHTSCLRSWFQRQQTCPTCRLNILRAPTGPTTNNNNIEEPAARPEGPPLPRLRPAVTLNQAARGEAVVPQAPQMFNPFAALRPNPGAFQAAPLFNDIRAPQVQVNAPTTLGAANVQEQQPNGAPSVTTAGSQSNTQQGDGPNLPQPQFIPPFPFAMPFIIPAPIPPTNMANLTEDDLRRLEGNERANVEARIQCLRNIQTLLDAAVQLMFQYSAATTVPSTTDHVPASSSHNNGIVPDFSNLASNLASFTNGTPSTSNNVHFNGTVGTDEAGDTTPLATTNVNSIATNGTNNDQADESKNKDNGENDSNKTASCTDEEIRQKRLQRFLQQEQEQN